MLPLALVFGGIIGLLDDDVKRHYNEDMSAPASHDVVPALREMQRLSAAKKRLAICVVDITDFPASLPVDLISRAGLTDVIVAANKADALALGFSRTNDANRIRNIVSRQYEDMLARAPLGVHLISAHTRQGVQPLFNVGSFAWVCVCMCVCVEGGGR